MSKYIPFLKLKSNEIMAVKELETDLRQALTPFFDFPYKKDRTEEDFIRTAERMFRSIRKNINDIPFFYLDNFDVDSSLTVDGGYNYVCLLNVCKDLPVVPVISIDRNPEHMQAVCEAKDSGDLKTDTIALRFVAADFESFDVVADDIEECLSDTFRRFAKLDLVLDCRVCSNQVLDSLASNATNFIQKFTTHYTANKIIVTGSSIPASIGDILGTQQEVVLARAELDVFDRVYNRIGGDFNIVLGDYGVVSPIYSDISVDPRMILNITTSKIFYTFDRHHYVIRGSAIKTHKKTFGQYYDHAAVIVTKPFYRGANYSFGDNFIEEKSRSLGSYATPSTIIKPTVNLHITYMLNDYV